MGLVVPFGSRGKLMKLLATLFAKVLFWAHFLAQNAHTASMLPDLACVTLYKHASSVLSSKLCHVAVSFRAADQWHRKPRVLNVSAYTACDTVITFFILIFEGLIRKWKRFFVSASRATGWGLCRLLLVARRLRAGIGASWRGIFMMRARTSLSTAR